jgi:uncharacterized protein (TIGR02996 family)
MSQSVPPEAVLFEFLRRLSDATHPEERKMFVLRGSLLLKYWFGARARPAADIDLECFESVRANLNRGRPQRFMSVADNVRGLCTFAAEEYRQQTAAIEFRELDFVEGGHSLWEYGSPGERYFLGWSWPERQNERGLLQVDIAEAGSYSLGEISAADLELHSEVGTFNIWCYSQEMMLAAKVSWLIRSIARQVNGPEVRPPKWTGQPKDLFDVHLLLTQGTLNAQEFQKAMLAVGRDDEVEWGNLQALFDVRHGAMTDADFPNWADFRQQHDALVSSGPVELLEQIVDRLEPLLGDFYRREEMPFLLTINANPLDESVYLIYADWLDDHGDQRAAFLRLFTKFLFRAGDLPKREFHQIRTQLCAGLKDISQPWLCQLYGTSQRMREMLQRIEQTKS